MLVPMLVNAPYGHGSMIMPPARNSIDASPGMPWAGGKHPPTGSIEPYTCFCNNGTSLCNNGQACFWFSQGVSIGCKAADGNGRRYPNFDHCVDERAADFDPLTMDGALHPKYRTTNVNSRPGSIDDIWKYNPWRAPGKGPLADPCGMAGGTQTECFNAGAYNSTKFAKQGDLATNVLKKRTDLYQTVWTRGAVERTRWETTAAHGGGYIYQLCPASSTPLTEECFAASPLAFATPHTQKIIHSNTSLDFEIAMIVIPETASGGAGWALNPFPYASDAPCDWDAAAGGGHCTWACAKCGAPHFAADTACPDPGCRHAAFLSHNISYGAAIPDLTRGSRTVEDSVVVPKDLSAGEYVLRWRWDCEASSQVWTTCSDITIV